MTSLKNKIVAVTGAASGIGRGLAEELVARGAHVALSDVNEDGLNETASLVKGGGCKVSTHLVDVRDWEAMQKYAAEVEAFHGGADIIINNAGVAVRASVEDISIEDFQFVLDINLWGVIHGTKAFMPAMRRRSGGHIVNISSINGMVPFARQAPYNVSKYAVLGFSESLMQELRGDPIHVSVVHPGGIQTNIANDGRNVSAKDAAFFNRIAMTSSSSAARTILNGVEGDRERIYVGRDAKLMAAAKRMLPDWTVRLVGAASDRGGA